MEKSRGIRSKIENNFEISLEELFYIILMVFVVAGILGFVYETFFYRIDLGYFTKRGTTFGPWIPIYGFGGLFIALLTYHFRKHPFVVFLLSGLISGVLEFSTGYILYHYAGGLRLWDYNTEIWNWGNIGGYICARSVLLFAFSGLALIYLIFPLLRRFYDSANQRAFKILSVILSFLFVLDMILSSIA